MATTNREDLPAAAPEVVRLPGVCGGDPILAGTRTPVHDVVSYVRLWKGDLERVRSEELPHLSLDQIRAALDWYEQHRDEIDPILAARQAEYTSSPKGVPVVTEG